MRHECKTVFDKLKLLLTTSPTIQPPNWELSFELICDASHYAVAAMLGQSVGRATHVIYYASRTLDPTQDNYSMTEKEFLVVVFALEKIIFIPVQNQGRRFFPNHAAIEDLLAEKEVKPRLIRWILLLR